MSANVSNAQNSCKCDCTYDCLIKWTRFLTFGIAGTVVGLGIQKFFNIFNTVYIFSYIINIYLIFLGLILFVCEMGWERFLQHFNFLRFYLGKAFYVLFLGLISFDTSSLFQTIVGIICFVVTIFYIVLGGLFHSAEVQRVEDQKKNSQKYNNPGFGSR